MLFELLQEKQQLKECEKGLTKREWGCCIFAITYE